MTLTYHYSTVNAGKTAKLILNAHAHKARGVETLVLLPEIAVDRESENTLSSRAGLSCRVVHLPTDKCPCELIEDMEVRPEIVFIDESQFLSAHQVKGLCNISDRYSIPVSAFGLRTNYHAEPFEGSIYLMAWADRIVEVPTPSSKEKHIFATMNIKVTPNSRKRVVGDGTVDVGFNFEPVSRNLFGLDENWIRK